MKVICLTTILIYLSCCLYGDAKQGEQVFKMFCASCHGPEGAGLVGPNLTDKEILHGDKKEDIVKVINNGVQGKAMPAWGAILKPEQIDDVADFIKSIMGKNLPSPFAEGKSSVTPFPKGSSGRPLLMRTFMPKMGISDEVFAHHFKGLPVPHYSQIGRAHV